MGASKTADEPPRAPASEPYLDSGHGLGPPAMIRRNQAALNRPPRKYLRANKMRRSLCHVAAE